MLNNYLTISQAARYKSCSRQTIYNAIRSGRLKVNTFAPDAHMGRVIRKSDIDRFALQLNQHAAQPQKASK